MSLEHPHVWTERERERESLLAIMAERGQNWRFVVNLLDGGTLAREARSKVRNDTKDITMNTN